MDLNELKELLQILEEKEITEFELEESGKKLRIRKAAASHNHASVPSGATPPAQRRAAAGAQGGPERPQPAEQAAAEEQGLVVVKSPIVGTFYRAADPNSTPFVNVGDSVTVGQVLCIIEAMKLMNEIESKVAGRIAKVVVENGQPVEFGQALFLVEPLR